MLHSVLVGQQSIGKSSIYSHLSTQSSASIDDVPNFSINIFPRFHLFMIDYNISFLSKKSVFRQIITKYYNELKYQIVME